MASKYSKKLKELEKVFPDDELRKFGREYGTARKDTNWDNICRVVPADYIEYPVLLEMPKENTIYPESIIPEMYKLLRVKLKKLQNNRRR